MASYKCEKCGYLANDDPDNPLQFRDFELKHIADRECMRCGGRLVKRKDDNGKEKKRGTDNPG